jgi:hypothetical protein
MLTGRIFSREKLRDDRWNLTKVVPHLYEGAITLRWSTSIDCSIT